MRSAPNGTGKPDEVIELARAAAFRMAGGPRMVDFT